MVPPPPIQGIGNAAGATMQIELRDSSFDLAKLQASVDGLVDNAATQSSLQRVQSSFRSGVPQFVVEVDRVKAETQHVTLDQVFSALSGYVGSSYVDQFNKFGRTFQIYLQADSQFRLRPEDVANLTVRSQDGHIIPLGTLGHHHAHGRPVADQPLQPLSLRDRDRDPGGGRGDRATPSS